MTVHERLAFIDWMKCLGIFVIVYGHIAGGSVDPFTTPIHFKQLGVAMFMFVIGFGLVRASRSPWRTVWDRLFEVYAAGFACAVAISIIAMMTRGDINESNYLPLALGANILFDNFPANPTTWFIGTYIHVLLLWALWLRRVDIRPVLFLYVVPLEILGRAVLASEAGGFIAYMSVLNWATVFLLGMWQGSRHHRDQRLLRGVLLIPAVVAVLGLLVVQTMPAVSGFPFSFVSILRRPFLGLLLSSTAISLWYVMTVLVTYEVTRRCASYPAVRFFARNTIVIFVVHMPVYYALGPRLADWSYWTRVAIEFAVCCVGLACASEALRRVVRYEQLRDSLWKWCSAWTSPTAAPSV